MTEPEMEGVSPKQAALLNGKKHYFAIPAEIPDRKSETGWSLLVIYGYTKDWLSESYDEYDEETRAEMEEERRLYLETLKRGYVMSRSYSMVLPYGEYGSHHASRLLPISEENFEQAKASNWDPYAIADVIAKGILEMHRWRKEAKSATQQEAQEG